MKIGIRTKFLILISIMLLMIFGAITVFQIRSNTRTLRNNLFEQSRAFATLATQPIGNVFAVYKDSGTFKIDQQMDHFLSLNDSITNIAVVDVSGKTIFSRNKDVKVQITSDEASTFEPIYKKNQAGALSTIIYPYFEASNAHRFSMVYMISDSEINTAVQNEASSLMYFGITSLLVTLGLLYWLINRIIIKPVKQVSEQALLISSGNLEQQVLIKGKDEIASLGESVNKMAESLKADIAKLQEVDRVKSEFMMITSHNLRTPLTIISGYLDNMNLVMGEPDKVMSAIKRIGSSVKRLEVFAEDVLTISRFELGDAQLQTDTVTVEQFIGKICTDFKPTAEQKNIKFISNINDGAITLKISSAYIRSAVWNILDNAVKFTKDSGTISLDTQKVGNELLVKITDNGIGISKVELPKLFTKFHRGTSTLTYDFEGTGIGLYASKVMVEKQGGTIEVQSKEGVGSTFTIKIPISA